MPTPNDVIQFSSFGLLAYLAVWGLPQVLGQFEAKRREFLAALLQERADFLAARAADRTDFVAEIKAQRAEFTAELRRQDDAREEHQRQVNAVLTELTESFRHLTTQVEARPPKG